MVESNQKLMVPSNSYETRLSYLSLPDTFPGCETRMVELTPEFGKTKLKPSTTLAPTLRANPDATPHPAVANAERSRDLSSIFDALRGVSEHETPKA